MGLARNEQQATDDNGRACERRLAKVLASRDSNESIRYCAGYLKTMVSRHEGVKDDDSFICVNKRLARSLPKALIVKQAGQEEHRPVLEKTFCLISRAKHETRRKRLAARMMLAELRQEDVRALAAGHERTIRNVRSHVQGFVERAEGWIESLDDTAGLLRHGYGGSDKERAARRDVLKLKGFIDGLFVLAASGQDLPLAMRALRLVASPWGRDSPNQETGDLGTIAAQAVLRGLDGQRAEGKP